MNVHNVPDKRRECLIIGAGPAGLTAAFELIKQGIKPIVLEKSMLVGGISRTECYKGFYFDMGGHRFFSKSNEVNQMWAQILGDRFMHRPRLSRIYYNKKFFKYPPEMINALKGFGFLKSMKTIGSYLYWQILPYRQVETFEHWVTNAFGKHLFETFFKTYTEKVWGISCNELRADWAAQRIKNLSLRTVATSMFRNGSGDVKSLIEQFHYPAKGPGMMWQAFSEVVEGYGGDVQLGTEVTEIQHAGGKVTHVVSRRNGKISRQIANEVISSMPLTQLIRVMRPLPPAPVMEAARTLKYRDFLIVCLVLDNENLFPDNWIYVHDNAVQVCRIQNFKNWSPEMVPTPKKTSLGMEYFCNRDDELWRMSDAELIELASWELEKIGLAKHSQIEDGVVYRVPYAYPVYDAKYGAALDRIKDYLRQFQNLHTIGRNGLHRYNNQDHSMLTGIYAVRNMLNGHSVDIWKINGEDDYHEEIDEPHEVREITGGVVEAPSQA